MRHLKSLRVWLDLWRLDRLDIVKLAGIDDKTPVLGHRQTKGAATDMLDLPPPRHISTLRVSSVPSHPGEGLFEQTVTGRWRHCHYGASHPLRLIPAIVSFEHTAGTQPFQREPLFLRHSRHPVQNSDLRSGPYPSKPEPAMLMPLPTCRSTTAQDGW